MRRWSLRILIALAVLLILVIVVTQIVLSATTIPDRIVLSEVQQQLGLRMTAKSVDTGWFGSTVIKDVTISLPLAENSLLATPRMRVRHTWLPKLLVTRKLVIDVLELDDAQLVVSQDAAGRWNLQDLVELLARTGGKQQAATTSTKRAGPKLPGVILHNGTVTVTDKAGRVAKLNPVEFSGLPEGLLVWRYDATVGSAQTPTIKAVGKLSPGFEWAHQVEFDVNGAGPLLEPWVGKLAEPLNVAGTWEGELKDNQAIGRLTLTKAQAMGGDMSGIVRARAGGGTARVEPEKLTIKTSQKLLPELQVRSGAIDLTGTTIRATRMQVAALAGVAQVDGRWAMEQDSGEIVATWDELTEPGVGVTNSGGRLSAAVTNTLGQRSVTADLSSNGAVRGGNWRTQMKLTGGGRNWQDMNWQITAPALSWSGPPRDVMLDGLVANLVTRGKVVELTSMQLPSAERVSGKGLVDFEKQTWALNLAGRGWPLPRVPEATLEFRLDGGGDFKLYKLNELFLKTGDVLVSGKGFYDRKIPKPMSLDVQLRHTPTAAAGETNPALQGTLRAETHVSGEAWPLDVGLSGKVFGEAVRVSGRVIGDVAIDVEGKVTRDQANLTSKELELLGGKWSLLGTWAAETDLARVRVKVRDLPLAQCGEAMGRSDVTGTADGAWTFELPNFDRARLTASGEFEARQIKVGEFPVERAVGKMTMRSGRIDAGPIDLTEGEGKAVANVSVALSALKQPTVGLSATNWPVNLPAANAALRVNVTDTKLDVDLAARRATGPLTASADVTLEQQALGKGSLAADLNGHSARVKSFEVNAFGGKAAGNGNFDLDNLLATTGELKWQDIDSTAIAAIFPKINGIAGRYGGRATLRPANDPRALEPLRLDIVLDSYGGSFKGATVGDATFTAFMNYETAHDKPGVGDRFRIVLSDTQDDPSLIRFADGIVRVWARFGRHRGIRTPAGQITLDLDRLSLDQLVHVAKKENKTMPGRVSGTITVAGPPDDPARLFGTGTLRLTEADLGNAPGFDVLYIAMGKGADGGRGSLDLRLEASNLYLDSIKYFSKGTEVRGRGVIREAYTIPQSPIEFIAIGSVRPFSALKLPWASDVDDILNAVASNVTTVIVDGTAADPKRRLVPFSELTDSMKSFIVGDVKAETQSR